MNEGPTTPSMQDFRFQDIASRLPEPLLLVTSGGELVEANAAAVQRLNLHSQELRGVTLASLVRDAPERLRAYLTACARSRQPVPGRLHWRSGADECDLRCDGSLLRPASEDAPALILLRCVPAGQSLTQFAVLNQKIEQLSREMRLREQAEARARHEREWFRVTLSSIGDAVIATDREQRVTLMNPIAEALTGTRQADAAGRGLTEVFRIVHEETLQPVENPCEKVLRTGRVVELANHTALIHRDGSMRPIEDTAAPIRSTEGEILGVVLVFHDVSALRRTARELQDLNQSLEERIAERTALAERRAAQLRTMAAELAQAEERERRRMAQLLHDGLQQILVAAKFNVGALRARVEDPGLRDAVDQLDGLLGDSVEASRSLTLQLSPPILYEGGLVPGLAWLGRWVEKHHGLRVRLDADPQAEPRDESTRVLLFQAARELLLNVVKHAGVDRAELRLAAEGDAIRIDVIDHGRGFDPARLDRNGEQGFGLLNIRERLDLMDGSLTIESRPGEGAHLTLRAPRDTAASAATPATGSVKPRPGRAAPAAQASEGPTRVLLVDDHKILRHGLRQVLESEPGIEVVGEASNGREAIERCATLRPDVVVMDITMPVMTGVEATRHIARDQPGIRIIGLSMHEEGDMARAMTEAGAAAYLTKGGPPEELIAAIRAALPGRQPG